MALSTGNDPANFSRTYIRGCSYGSSLDASPMARPERALRSAQLHLLRNRRPACEFSVPSRFQLLPAAGLR
jgi:hypothetical protein